jgi:hypothetical protein
MKCLCNRVPTSRNSVRRSVSPCGMGTDGVDALCEDAGHRRRRVLATRRNNPRAPFGNTSFVGPPYQDCLRLPPNARFRATIIRPRRAAIGRCESVVRQASCCQWLEPDGIARMGGRVTVLSARGIKQTVWAHSPERIPVCVVAAGGGTRTSSARAATGVRACSCPTPIRAALDRRATCPRCSLAC